jgi:hypothetical protein
MAPNDSKTIIIIILSFLAGILSLALYQQLNEAPADVTTDKSIPTETRDLTQDELGSITNPPGPDASEPERQAYFDIVARAAVPAEYLDITACLPSPIAFLTEHKQPMTVKNNDATEHTLRINQDHVYTIPPESDKTIIADFGFGAGFYGYACDESEDTAGMLFVVDQLQ